MFSVLYVKQKMEHSGEVGALSWAFRRGLEVPPQYSQFKNFLIQTSFKK